MTGLHRGYGEPPEPVKETPEWVSWVVLVAVVVLFSAWKMPADEWKALVGFLGWAWKPLAIGALVIGGLLWLISTSKTAEEAKTWSSLAVTVVGLLMLLLCIMGMLRGVGLLGDDDRGNRERAPFEILFRSR